LELLGSEARQEGSTEGLKVGNLCGSILFRGPDPSPTVPFPPVAPAHTPPAAIFLAPVFSPLLLPPRGAGMVVVATAVRWPGGAHGGPAASRARRPAATGARRVGAEPERKAVTVRFGTRPWKRISSSYLWVPDALAVQPVVA
jgi:hypothetical protein